MFYYYCFMRLSNYNRHHLVGLYSAEDWADSKQGAASVWTNWDYREDFCCFLGWAHLQNNLEIILPQNPDYS